MATNTGRDGGEQEISITEVADALMDLTTEEFKEMMEIEEADKLAFEINDLLVQKGISMHVMVAAMGLLLGHHVCDTNIGERKSDVVRLLKSAVATLEMVANLRVIAQLDMEEVASRN